MASDRRWSGGAANREWNRAAGQEPAGSLPPEEEHELYLSQLHQSFYCDTCGSSHPLREHTQCRGGAPAEAVARPVTPGQTCEGGC